MIQHEKDGYDVLAGTYQPMPCFFGRPSWPTVFTNIAKNNAGGRVGVFVCGPPALSSQLKGVCTNFNSNDSKLSEKDKLLHGKACEFLFHKESF